MTVPREDGEADQAGAVGALDVLARVSVELHQAGERLAGFQNLLSDILCRAHVSQSDVTKLQLLDETTQLLHDLARAVEIVEQSEAATEFCHRRQIDAALRLGGLRQRLCGGRGETAGETDGPGGEVNLF